MIALLIVLFLFSGCSPRFSDEYISCYRYLSSIRENRCQQFQGSEYALIVLVDARHLLYAKPEQFFSTLTQGLFLPTDRSIGHAWIVLKGKEELYEVGHSGEYGIDAPKYFDELLNLSRHNDANPARYLFSLLSDGRKEKGSGGHVPSYAVAFPISHEQFMRVQRLFQAYDFSSWGLRGPNCVRFVLSALSCIGKDICCQETILLPSSFQLGREKVLLWKNPLYSCISLNAASLVSPVYSSSPESSSTKI